MLAVLPDLPMVNPLVPRMVKFVSGQESAEVKLVEIGSTVKVPVFLKFIAPAILMLLACKTIFPLVAIELPTFVPILNVVPEIPFMPLSLAPLPLPINVTFPLVE